MALLVASTVATKPNIYPISVCEVECFGITMNTVSKIQIGFLLSDVLPSDLMVAHQVSQNTQVIQKENTTALSFFLIQWQIGPLSLVCDLYTRWYFEKHENIGFKEIRARLACSICDQFLYPFCMILVAAGVVIRLLCHMPSGPP